MKAILDSKDLELGFVWNRSYENLLGHVDDHLILKDLSKFAERYADCLKYIRCESQGQLSRKIYQFFCRKVDLIVEVAHPCITDEFGERFLEHADYMVMTDTDF